MILLDTNVFVEILLGGPSGHRALERMGTLAEDETLAYAAITWFELYVQENQRKAARELLSGFQGVPLTLAIAEKAAELFGRHMAGNRRKIPDALIAATALESDASLWTLDRSDFRKIPGLSLFS